MATEEEIYNFLNALETPGNASANEYGLGFDGGAGDLYKTLGYNVSGLKDIGSIAGIQWSDFAGVPEAPEAPDWTPFQSDLQQLYAGNQTMQAIADGILAGGVPQVVTANVLAAATNKNSPMYDPSFEGVQVDPEMLAGQGFEYAKQLAQQNREQSQFQGERQAYDDYFKSSSEWEQQGAPTEEALIEKYLKRGVATDNRPVVTAPGASLLDRRPEARAMLDSLPAMGGRQPSTPLGQVPGVREALNAMEAPADLRTRGTTPGTLGRRPSFTSGSTGIPSPKAVPSRRDANSVWTGNKKQDDEFEKMLKIAADKKIGRMKSRTIQSPAEQTQKAQLQMAWNLIFGEPAPTKRG